MVPSSRPVQLVPHVPGRHMHGVARCAKFRVMGRRVTHVGHVTVNRHFDIVCDVTHFRRRDSQGCLSRDINVTPIKVTILDYYARRARDLYIRQRSRFSQRNCLKTRRQKMYAPRYQTIYPELAMWYA